MKRLLITTPIYYVNDKPHIGHAYTTIAGDYLARFHRLSGREVFYLTGTDEHGTKIAEAAAAAGETPQAFCDRIVATFVQSWKALGIDYSYFVRTTSQRHIQGVERLLDVMRSATAPGGEPVIYSDFYEGLYCTGCEKFLTEKELVNGRCPDHGTVPEKLKEKNYFFRLSAYLPPVKAAIESGRLQILPEEKRNEVLGLLNAGLPDFSISRERVSWGIPLSFDTSQVAYVWVDALSNYITAIGYGDNRQEFATWWSEAEVVQLMGKEILKFHCLFWPSMLLAAGEKIPEQMFLHGWFTVDGSKMSKSLGNSIDPNDLVGRFGPDASRYLLMTQYPFGIDGDIQANRFLSQYNADLANDLGNLVSRVFKLIETGCDGKLPQPLRQIAGLDTLLQVCEAAPAKAYGHVKQFRLHAAIAEGLQLIRATNKFFADAEPWKLAKAGKSEELGGVLYACCEALRIASILLYPILPGKMTTLRAALGLDASTLTLDKAQVFFDLLPGTPIALAEPLFPRLEDAGPVAAVPPAPAAKKTDESAPGLVDISEVGKVALRVATVLEAERVEGATKLLRLQIDVGTDKRQIVAGIAEHYAPEEIIGRRIIVVANLKPAVIRGITSNGMLLAAKSGGVLRLVMPDGELPPGATVS